MVLATQRLGTLNAKLRWSDYLALNPTPVSDDRREFPRTPGIVNVTGNPDMSRNGVFTWRWLAAVVVGHLLIAVAHGAAHDGAQVPLSPAANLFVYIVILAGPIAGLALAWRAERPGHWVIAATMAGSLVFGFVNHFVLASPDHVSHVDPQWQPLFASTAVLLAATEAIGCGLAIHLVRGRSTS